MRLTTYMVYQCRKFDAVLNVLLQDIQNFHQFLRPKLWIKEIKWSLS